MVFFPVSLAGGVLCAGAVKCRQSVRDTDAARIMLTGPFHRESPPPKVGANLRKARAMAHQHNDILLGAFLWTLPYTVGRNPRRSSKTSTPSPIRLL